MRAFLPWFLLLFVGCSPIVSVVTAAGPSINNRVLVGLINGYRKTNGLEPLKENMRLCKSSELKADEMATEGYFGHTSPGGDPFFSAFQKANYKYTEIGEILARGCDSAECLFKVWVNSSQHRQIILNSKFQDIGCGTQAAGPEDRYFAVCHFGRPAK
jgi:uncharacterized protein YkwD